LPSSPLTVVMVTTAIWPSADLRGLVAHKTYQQLIISSSIKVGVASLTH
jgi:hypothetical protein